MRVAPVVGSMVLAAVVLLLASDTSAQDAQPPVFRASVEVLPVDVTVTDRNGRQVTTLTAGDFQVEVDGRPRRVVSAAYVRLVDPVADAAGAPAPPPVDPYASSNVAGSQRGRFILLLVDQGNIRVGAVPSVMRSAARFLDRLSPADRVAVVAIPAPGVLVDFTTDHQKAREALISVTGQFTPFRKRFNISLTEALAVTQSRDMRVIQSLLARECGVFISAMEAERCEREVEQEAGEMMFHQRDVTSSSLRGMREVFRSLRDLDAPKSVILISEGLVLEGLGHEVDEIAALASDARASLDVLLLDVPLLDATQSRLPPTAQEDRWLQEAGLEMLAGLARGGLYRVTGSAAFAFDRVHQAMAGYYLLGLEATPGDQDGRRHQIRVRTTRPGLTIYSRRGFLAPEGPGVLAPADAVTRALQSSVPASALPLRLSTWTYKEPGSPRVRLLFAVEIERATDQPLDYVTGLVVADPATGRAITTGVETRALGSDAADPGLAVHSGSLTVDPGTYRVRFAAADHQGRVGSVEREVHAWHTEGEAFALGDLLLSPAPDDERTSLAPAVEPRVHNHQLIALTEIYGASDDLLDALEARLDVARDETSDPLASFPMQLAFGDSREVRTAQALIDTSVLPPGRYLARAVVLGDGKPLGDLARPFRVMPRGLEGASPGAGGAARGVHDRLTDALPAFNRDEVLSRNVLDPIWRLTGEGRPAAVKAAVDQAAGGRYGAGAVAAFEAGDQMVAAFLRGIELFDRAQWPQATIQLQNALSMAPSFAPARLFLGAIFAAQGRHRDAAGLLTSAATDALPVAGVGRMAGEAWLRAGEVAQAIPPLERAVARGGDPRASRALGLAYVLADRPGDGLPLLSAYLDAAPDDEAALLAALYGVYTRHLGAPIAGEIATDRARARAWADAYGRAGGALMSLVTAWVTYLDSLP